MEVAQLVLDEDASDGVIYSIAIPFSTRKWDDGGELVGGLQSLLNCVFVNPHSTSLWSPW
jgi:hypothetical protein